MKWTPNKWIAAILGFFLLPLGMLYVLRVKWAIVYFVSGAVIAILDIIALYKYELALFEYFSLTWVLMIICAVHSYKTAASTGPVETRPWYSKWYGLTSIPVVILVAVFMFRSYVYEPFRMPSASMFPSINPGSLLIVEKCGYGNYGTFGLTVQKTALTKEIHRGEIIIFQYPRDETVAYLKRVIGLPGDTISYRDKKLSINDRPVETGKVFAGDGFEAFTETLDGSLYQVANSIDRQASGFTVTVPDNSYFVMGDNRDNSSDSRHWGAVPAGNIVGKVTYILEP